MNWKQINHVRSSFLSKAFTAYALSVTLLSQSEFALSVFGAAWKLRVTMLGAVVFLIGYILPYIFASPEFKEARSKQQTIANWVIITNKRFFESRVKLFRNLLDRFSEKLPFDLDAARLTFANTKLAELEQLEGSVLRIKLRSPELYDLELDIRAYDQPFLRVVVTLVLLTGGLAMSVPLLANTFSALCGFLGVR